jgi:hypothetical protein
VDSGYGGPGSVGSMHSSSSSAESPMHCGAHVGSFPNSPWTNPNQEYMNQSSPYIYSYDSSVTSSSSRCLQSPQPFPSAQLQPKPDGQQHLVQPYPPPFSSDSLSSVSFFVPTSTPDEAGAYGHMEDESQFEFGGCSQEEISNLVDQVPMSLIFVNADKFDDKSQY